MALPLPSLPPFVIGMVHFPPLVGREGALAPDAALVKARSDFDVLLDGGMPAVMFENMYDFPHTERLDPPRREEYRSLLAALTPGLRMPFGLSVLWNDYSTAFALAVEYGAQWVRVPVFVDSVETQYGVFHADPAAVLAERVRAGADHVRILADIQVKHARMLEPRPLADSACAAEAAGADAIIVTGTWTGDPPTVASVREAKSAVGIPVLIGSGMTSENVSEFLAVCDGCIVGTALKASVADSAAHRLRAPWRTPVDLERVRAFLDAVRAASA
ncbi:BtpA/SgcQ family protein [Candidatus Uhrbacteria bacterium]|nr:BtpA/SgcQ family protein [Candidatus Uhrbacteria bacterium]